jgi:hypothetical protein
MPVGCVPIGGIFDRRGIRDKIQAGVMMALTYLAGPLLFLKDSPSAGLLYEEKQPETWSSAEREPSAILFVGYRGQYPLILPVSVSAEMKATHARGACCGTNSR